MMCAGGELQVASCVGRGVVKNTVGMMDWLHILDLFGNLNETKTPLFE